MSPLTARCSFKTIIMCASSAALLLCATLIAPASASAATRTDAQLAAAAAATINNVRATQHLPRLAVQPHLKTSSAAHTARMARANKLTTRLKGEAAVPTRVRQAGYAAAAATELVGMTTSQAKVTKVAKALVSRSRTVRVMGITVRTDRVHKKIWITVDYAAPKASAAAKSATPEQTIANGVLAMLDGERQAHGRAPLVVNAKLLATAHAHNLAMARANTMSHQLAGELDLGDRILRAGYDYHYAGENVGYNWDMTLAGAKQLEQLMYDEGPPSSGAVNHYANIISSQYKNVGIDIYLDNAHHRLWITEDFGTSF